MPMTEAIRSVMQTIEQIGGNIGVVAIDAQGNIVMPFSGGGMKRGYVREDGKFEVRLYADR